MYCAPLAWGEGYTEDEILPQQLIVLQAWRISAQTDIEGGSLRPDSQAHQPIPIACQCIFYYKMIVMGPLKDSLSSHG
jgi:hypothetical protein